MKTYFGLLIIIIITFQSCNRCDKEHTYNLTDITNAYFGDFTNGEKWIFTKSSDSSFVDTLVMTSKSQDLEFSFTETECDGDYFEIITYHLISSKLNDTMTVRLKSGPNSDNYSLKGFYDDIEIACYHQIDKSSGLFEPHPDNHLNVFETYKLNSNDYHDVVEKTFNTFSPSFPEEAPRYLHSNGVGLIEFEIFNENLNKRINYSLIKKETN